jgi:arylsulfatase A-like enzyme
VLAGIQAIDPVAATGSPTTPNIVLIVTDDMRWDEMERMPTVQAELIGKGTWFLNGFVVNSLCCPSRASILTGRYSHSTGVWTNTGPNGGFRAFKRVQGSTIATWLDAAGYQTGFFGKVMNGYSAKQAPIVSPGWDRWVAMVQPPNYFNYDLSIDGHVAHFGSSTADYSTDVLAGYAESFLADLAPGEPFFMEFAPYAPHAPFIPAPRHAASLADYQPISPPNAAEADVSDKPAWVRALPLVGGNWNSKRKAQMRMLLAVDEAIARLIAIIDSAGQIDNTLFVFTSDNSLSGGSHRWFPKETGWDEALHVPFVLRYDPLTGGVPTSSDALALNIDIAPTIADLAGVAAPGVEGVSLRSVLDGTETFVRTDFGIEHLKAPSGQGPPSYCGVRTTMYKYIRYSTGEEELYDLVADPFEMQSKHADPAHSDIKDSLRARAQALCSPPPPGYSF